MTSVVTGTALPFALAKGGIDPANAGTSIQVLPLTSSSCAADPMYASRHCLKSYTMAHGVAFPAGVAKSS